MAEKIALQEQLPKVAFILDRLIAMTDAARDAFKHQRSQPLQDLQTLQQTVTEEIIEKDGAISKALREMEAPQIDLLKLHSILSHLHLITETLGSLNEPIAKQIREGVLFSDKAFAQTGQLFDSQKGILHSLAELIRTRDSAHKYLVVDEGQKLHDACIEFASDHEARLIEGLCLPHAAPIFLGILDRMRTLVKHEQEAARLIDEVLG